MTEKLHRSHENFTPPRSTKGYEPPEGRRVHFTGTSFGSTKDYEWTFYTDGSVDLSVETIRSGRVLYTRNYAPGVIESKQLSLRYNRIMLPDLREDS